MLADIILHFTETTYMSLRKQWELISPLATNEVWGDVLTLAFTAVKSKYLRRFNRSSKTDILRNEPLGAPGIRVAIAQHNRFTFYFVIL